MVLAFLVWWFWTLRAKTQGIFNCAEGSPWNGGPLKYWIWVTWIYGLSKLNQLALALKTSPLMWCLVRNFSGISRCIQGAFVGQGNSASIEPFPIFTSRCLMINCRNSATSVCRSSCSGQIVRFLSFGMVVGSPPHPEQKHSNDMLYLGEFMHASQRIGNTVIILEWYDELLVVHSTIEMFPARWSIDEVDGSALKGQKLSKKWHTWPGDSILLLLPLP